jgi:hypothetical protein
VCLRRVALLPLYHSSFLTKTDWEQFAAASDMAKPCWTRISSPPTFPVGLESSHCYCERPNSHGDCCSAALLQCCMYYRGDLAWLLPFDGSEDRMSRHGRPRRHCVASVAFLAGKIEQVMWTTTTLRPYGSQTGVPSSCNAEERVTFQEYPANDYTITRLVPSTTMSTIMSHLMQLPSLAF